MFDVKMMLNSWLKRFGYQFIRYRQDAFADQLRLLRQDNCTVFDVGANVGDVTRKYRELFPTATIHCFEPFHDSFDCLTVATASDKLIRRHELAISDSTGRREFYVNRKSTNNSLLKVSAESREYMPHDRIGAIDRVEVATTTLDDFCREYSVRHIDLLKMDIQGGEVMALRGAIDMLERAAIDVIYTEVLFGKLYEQQGDFHDLLGLLTRHGYVLYRLYNLAHNKNGRLWYGDALFVSPPVANALAREPTRKAA